MVSGESEVPNSPPVIKLETSFTSGTPEVQSMLTAVNEQKRPIFWYELFQGALDYNDWEKGRPSIECILEDGTRQSVRDISPEAQIAQIEVSNFTRDDEGLEPDNIRFIAHGGGEGTLGIWGRGLTVGATACLAGGLCEGISFSSRDKKGPWVGKGAIEITREDQTIPGFTLTYQRIESGHPDQTVITVHEPSPVLVDNLRSLPEICLPANPSYQFVRLAGADRGPKHPNVFTVYAEGAQEVVEGPHAFFSDGELKEFGVNVIASATEPLRAEILPREFVTGHRVTTSLVFADGLQVNARQWRGYALDWSFYGFREGDYSSNPHRSHDSLTLEGDASGIIAATLRKCDRPEVFLQIIRACTDESKCEEGEIDKNRFADLGAGTKQAIAKAWGQFLAEKGFSEEEVLITESSPLKNRAESEGHKVVLLNSEAFLQAIKESTDSKMADETLGIKQEPKATGEHTRVTYLGAPRHIEFASENLVRALTYSEGIITIGGTNAINIEFGAAATRRFLGEFGELDLNIREFVTDFIAVFGSQAPLQIVIDDGKNAVTFECSSNRYGDLVGSRVGISPKKGELVSSGHPAVRMTISPPQSEKMLILYSQFMERLTQDLSGLVDEKGQVSKDKYLDAHDASLLKGKIRKHREALVGAFLSLGGDRRLLPVTALPVRTLSMRSGLEDNLSLASRERVLPKPIHEFSVELRRYFRPDIVVKFRGRPPGIKDYLIESIASPYSQISLEDYVPIETDGGKDRADATITFNKTLPAGRYPIATMLGYRIVGFKTVSGANIQFSELQGKGMFLLNTSKEIPAGLTIYYQKEDRPDTNFPDDLERRQLVDVMKLDPGWSTLVQALREDTNLSGKQRLDVAMTAWIRAFTYNSEFGRRNRDNESFTDLINQAEGDCADCSRGFMALARAINMPSRFVRCQMPKLGKAVDGENLHAIVQSYIDGSWVTVEPQLSTFGSYLTEGYKLEPIHSTYLDLIKGIPAGRTRIREKSLLSVKGVSIASITAVVAGAGLAIFRGGASEIPILSLPYNPHMLGIALLLGGAISSGMVGVRLGGERMKRKILAQLAEKLAEMEK